MRQNPHVRICGGPGSATTLVYPTVNGPRRNMEDGGGEAGTERLRVTTDPEYFEEHAESMELWSPGHTLFNPPEFTARMDEPSDGKTLKDLLDG